MANLAMADMIGLVDVDSKIPNLALMKISAYHKTLGDQVKMYDPLFDKPDLMYASKVFDFTPDYAYLPTGCEVVKGGPGYDPAARLPFPDYDRIMPDYSLYGCDYALGRFTRGCPNSCPWCVVPKADGTEVRHVADLSDFWSGQKVVRLLGRHGIKPWRLMFYVLVGFNTSRVYDLMRIYKLRDLGVSPFVMPFDRSDDYQRRLARWCNSKPIFKTVPTFEEYVA